MIERFLDSLSNMGFLGVIIALVVFIGIPCVVEIAIGFALNCVLAAIKNVAVRRTLTVASFIIFLPCMIACYNAENITETERKLAPFSLSLRSKSRLLIIVNVIYIAGFYFLYSKLKG